MIDFEDNPTQLGNWVFERHEGVLSVISANDYEEMTWHEYVHYRDEWSPVDYFDDLIDALYSFKESGFDIKLTGEEFKKLIEGSHASLYGCYSCDYNGDCETCNKQEDSRWVNFNRYDFIKGYGQFRRLVLIRDDYKCLCCGNDNEEDLRVHHIRSFKDNLELATSVKNGATLCEECHTKYHKKYGWKGNQKAFSKFIKEMVD